MEEETTKEKLQICLFPGGKLFLYDKKSHSGEDPAHTATHTVVIITFNIFPLMRNSSKVEDRKYYLVSQSGIGHPKGVVFIVTVAESAL